MRLSKSQKVILFGDAVVLALVTLYGLASHEMLDNAGTDIWRTFLPWLVAWVVMGWHVGVFEVEEIGLGQAIVLPIWSMILASPLAGFLRAVLLDRDVVVLFVLIFGGISALAVATWRGLYWLLARRRATHG